MAIERNKFYQSSFLISIISLLYITPVCAHIKWFIHYNIVQPPLRIDKVLTKEFILLFIISAIVMYFFFVIDRLCYRKNYLPHWGRILTMSDNSAVLLMRICSAIFFLALWAYEESTKHFFLLTPELTTTNPFIPWLHLALGLLAVSRFTVPLLGVGILILYGIAVIHYGFYHLLDYIVFLGIAYFLIISLITGKNWRKYSFMMLFVTTGLSLLWGAIEKFAYPDRFYLLLNIKPYLSMGFSPYFYVTSAGFVEFALTFTLLNATSLIARLVAFGLNAIFILAIYEFGILDALGHLMILAVLIILIIRGPTDARYNLVLPNKTIWGEAYFMLGIYYLAFVSFFLMYYGFHYLCYGLV